MRGSEGEAGMERHGLGRHGCAGRYGWAWPGEAWMERQIWRGMAWKGREGNAERERHGGRGMAWRSMEGEAWPGEAGRERQRGRGSGLDQALVYTLHSMYVVIVVIALHGIYL